MKIYIKKELIFDNIIHYNTHAKSVNQRILGVSGRLIISFHQIYIILYIFFFMFKFIHNLQSNDIYSPSLMPVEKSTCTDLDPSGRSNASQPLVSRPE